MMGSWSCAAAGKDIEKGQDFGSDWATTTSSCWSGGESEVLNALEEKLISINLVNQAWSPKSNNKQVKVYRKLDPALNTDFSFSKTE